MKPTEIRKMNLKAELALYRMSVSSSVWDSVQVCTTALKTFSAVYVNTLLPVREVIVYSSTCVITVLPSH